MHPKTSARRAALRILATLDESEAVLPQALEKLLPHVAVETRGLARELASGTLRHRARLDWTLAPLLKKPLEKLDSPVRAALRLCCYERIVLKTPAPVLGSEYSALIKSEKLSSAVGLITAVARRLPDVWRESPDAARDAVSHLAIEYSHPAWLVERWLERFGFDECAALCEKNNEIAPLCLRVNTLRAAREEVLSSLQARDVRAASGLLSSYAVLVEKAGDPTAWPEWEEGQIIAQDEGAQLVSIFARPQPGQIVIDTCAAPGGKSTHMAQLMQNTGTIISCDVSEGRLKLVRENAKRLGITNIETREGDFRELSARLPRADLVLLDAPCLGTGTLRRRPDAKWRKTPQQLQELVALQRDLLMGAAAIVKISGVLVYSTCSLEPEENEEQVENFLREHSGWRLERTTSTLPHRNDCDGAFAARLCKIGN